MLSPRRLFHMVVGHAVRVEGVVTVYTGPARRRKNRSAVVVTADDGKRYRWNTANPPVSTGDRVRISYLPADALIDDFYRSAYLYHEPRIRRL